MRGADPSDKGVDVTFEARPVVMAFDVKKQALAPGDRREQFVQAQCANVGPGEVAAERNGEGAQRGSAKASGEGDGPGGPSGCGVYEDVRSAVRAGDIT